MTYDSRVRRESTAIPGVTFTIARMSLARRIELTKQVRELLQKLEYLEAKEGNEDRLEASILNQMADEVYLRWGLAGVEGLLIDGERATTESLIGSGPEALCREILEAIRSECSLAPEERKNS